LEISPLLFEAETESGKTLNQAVQKVFRGAAREKSTSRGVLIATLSEAIERNKP
jgi:hypothetical protein